jgi:hypothetical protein
MRSLSLDIGAGTRCELRYRTDYPGLSTGKDAFMRASLSELAAARGDNRARRDARRFIKYHRLGKDTDDAITVLKNAVREGTVIVVVDRPRSSGAGSRGSNEPTSRSITFTPSQLFRGKPDIATGIRTYARVKLRLAAADGIAIWRAKPGDMLPDGTIAKALADAQPFEYGKDAALPTGDSQLAWLPRTGGPADKWVVNPSGSGQMRLYDGNGNAAVDIDFDHDHGFGSPHAHNWDGNTRDHGNALSLLPY